MSGDQNIELEQAQRFERCNPKDGGVIKMQIALSQIGILR